jgi:hypothetical protein
VSGGMYELPSSGRFFAELTFRRYEWKDKCLIFFSAKYAAAYGSRGMQWSHIPLAAWVHILASRFLWILPSCRSSLSSSGDCLTTSHGFFMTCVGEPRGTVGISEASTALPFRRLAPMGAAAWPLDCVDWSSNSRNSCAPCLE